MAETTVSDYIFGLQGNAVLDAIVAKTADICAFIHAKSRQERCAPTRASATRQQLETARRKV